MGVIYGVATLITVLCVVLSVALMTLAERKVMGSMQRRVGPNKVGIWGILQPLRWLSLESV